MKGKPRAANANAAGLALTPARLASTIAASQPAPSISASAFSSFAATQVTLKPASTSKSWRVNAIIGSSSTMRMRACWCSSTGISCGRRYSSPLQRFCEWRTQFPGEPALQIVDLGCAVDCRLHHASDHHLAETLPGRGSDIGASVLQPGHQEHWLGARRDCPGDLHPPLIVRKCAV